MKRIQEKVKDIVDVRPYISIRDFIANPAETLSNYHFTDATSELMAKWLDGIAAVQPGHGSTFALAGYRGVGKSHFLATLGALAANPELRSRISESHVAFSAQRLQRRHYNVAYLRRGTHETLLDEFKAAIDAVFDIGGSAQENSYLGLLKAACEKSGETPFILMIDTAFERGSRVTRDDGTHLSEIGEAARDLNVFVGVALDDDIAGADGTNSSIVRSYSIDYLDQAHLYKVVNAHIFPKEAHMQQVLHDIYLYFREVLPSFRWSEQKFASLYPLHPAILEVAPYVRLYVHDFALLGFASAAGEKILGRPSNSLIALDEVYDSAENSLRKVEDLAEAFAAYDTLSSTVVGKIAVMQRLQAKLVLKALLLLSLDGQGASASDICASVLIFEESDPEKAVRNVEDLLKKFAEALPGDFRVVTEDGVESRYSFKVSSKENLNNALTEALLQVSVDAVPGIVLRAFRERFSDAGFDPDGSEPDRKPIESQIVWRGGIRRGRISWNTEAEPPIPTGKAADSTGADWEVLIDLLGEGLEMPGGSGDVSRVVWKPDPFRSDELDKLRSFHALSTNTELREKFNEQIRASVHAHSIVVEKILNRSFLEDGKLIIDGFDYNFTEDARSAQTLSELFSTMLEPLFETRFPDHPYFTKTLDHPDVASIVTDLYNGTRQDLADVQSRAQTFAFPLGLVRLEGTSFVPESAERLRQLPLVTGVLDLLETVGGKPVSLSDVFAQMQMAPHGIVREAQQMVLTALVAERQIEFVTTSGNRINRRSLDLKIVWDDIAGIARPIGSSFSAEKVRRWASIFIPGGEFESLDRAKDRETLQSAFREWSNNWNDSRLLDRFGQLPDDVLNVRIWQVAARAGKTFGSVAERIEAAAEGSLQLDECLDGIADAFSESAAEFKSCESELEILASFVKGAELRDEIRSYLAVCEVTDDREIEELREQTTGLVAMAYSDPSDAVNRELAYVWDRFKAEFSEYFETRHSAVMQASPVRSQLNDILKTDQWWEFEMLSDINGFDQRFVRFADEYKRRMSELDCRVDTKQILKLQPFCLCTFSLNMSVDSSHLPKLLNDSVSDGLKSFRGFLVKNAEDITGMVEKLSDKSSDAEFQEAARRMVSVLNSGEEYPAFSDIELKILSESVGTNDRFEHSRDLSPKRNEDVSKTVAGTPKPGMPSEAVDDELIINI